MANGKLRVGILGAARIAPMALIGPAKGVDEVEIACVAARDRRRAEAFAAKHGIPSVASSYEALLADESIAAVYNPLPNSLHAEWTIRALEAGKHVLCEKPFTSNEAEARQVADVAARSGRVVMEAFHWRYHPLAARMKEIVATELGALRRIETSMCIPLPLPGDIRYRLDLAGGATMDGAPTPSPCSATWRGRSRPSRARRPGSRRRASIAGCGGSLVRGGRTGSMTCSLWSATLLSIRARVVGELGTMSVFNPVAPQFYHHMTVETREGKRRERLPKASTYECQLRAFAGAVLRGEPVPTGPEDAVKNMRVIDAVYRAAGLPIRGA